MIGRFVVVEGMQYCYVVDRWCGLVVEETMSKEDAQKIAAELNREQMKRNAEAFGAGMKKTIKHITQGLKRQIERGKKNEKKCTKGGE